MEDNYRVVILVRGKERTVEFNTIDEAINFIEGSGLDPREYDLQEHVGWQTCKFGDQEIRIQEVLGR